MHMARRLFLLAAVVGLVGFTRAAAPQLGDAPPAPTPEMIERLRQQRGPQVLGPTFPLAVDTRRREEVRNFFRAMAGVPANIVFDSANNVKDQEAALMMSANTNLSHFPPNDWICYTANGAEAAGSSNLALGNAGPDAITAYIEDFGPNNRAAGHRRWLLYPQTETMGTGDIPEPPEQSHWSANAVWVADANYGGPRPATRDGFVAWPPAGYVPYLLTFPRWSFSLPNATYTGTIVTLSSNGVDVPVTLEPFTPNVGENSLVWFPTSMSPSSPALWPKPPADTTYTVQLQNVVLGGKSSNFTYTVTVFDPAVPGADTVLPAVTGPDTPAVNQANGYTFSAVPTATRYQWRSSQPAPFTAVDGAENGLADFTADTSPGYAVVIDDAHHSGSQAFHLAHPDRATSQRLTCTRILLPGPSAQLQFWSRLGYATTDETAKVEISSEGSGSWQTVFEQAGTDGRGETTFNQRTVPLGSWAGRTLQVRFAYESTGSRFPQTTSDVDWVFDDRSFSDTEELSSPVITDVPAGTSFVFSPTQTGGYALDVRAQVYSQYYLEWGPIKRLDAVVAATPSVQFTGSPSVAGTEVQIDFDVTNHRPDLTFELLKSPTLPGTWTTDPAAAFQTIVAGSKFRATTSTGGASQSFYRLSVK
jgi:hypothetical protein